MYAASRLRALIPLVIAWGVACDLTGCAVGPPDPCPPGSISLDCRRRCQRDGDCVAPDVCDRATQRCVARTLSCDPLGMSGADGGAEAQDGGTGTGCPADKECDILTRTCVPLPGAACTLPSDCRPGETCRDKFCAPDPAALSCKRDGECPPTQVCRLTVTPEGALRSVCGPPIGPSDAGSRCADGAECQSGICLLSGVCYGGCDAASAAADCHGHDGVICGQVVFSVTSTGSVMAVPSCTLAPMPCKTDRDCAAQGGVCNLGADPRDPSRLVTLCGPPRGPARAGGPCVDDEDCATGLCLGTYCFSVCQAATDCRSSATCRPVDFVLGTAKASVGTCSPAKACTSSASCRPATDESCAPQPNAAGTGLVLVCTPGLGQGTGRACKYSQDCMSGSCIHPGICVGGCGADADCPPGPQGQTELCRPLDLEVQGVVGNFKACQVRSPTCGRDAECTVPGEICRATRSLDDPTRIATTCGPQANPGKASTGKDCMLSSDCRSGYCMGFTSPPVCYGVCRTDADCPAGRKCYDGYVPYLTGGMSGQASATYDATSACAPDIGSRRTCQGDGSVIDCPTGEVCVALPDAQQVGWVKKCQKRIGTGKGGATCTDGKTCESGRCQSVGGVKRCIGLCKVGGAAVCATGTTCKSANLDIRVGKTAPLTFCQ